MTKARTRRHRTTWRSQQGFSLLEIVIAFSILIAVMVPMMNLFGMTGKAVNKSQNLTLAVGLAHKIAQHLHALPYDQIVDRAEQPLADGGADGIFNPLENRTADQSGNKAITAAHLPELHGFLTKHQVRYALDVVGDQPKDVKIIITWVEHGKNLMYSQRVYVAKY